MAAVTAAKGGGLRPEGRTGDWRESVEAAGGRPRYFTPYQPLFGADYIDFQRGSGKRGRWRRTTSKVSDDDELTMLCKEGHGIRTHDTCHGSLSSLSVIVYPGACGICARAQGCSIWRHAGVLEDVCVCVCAAGREAGDARAWSDGSAVWRRRGTPPAKKKK